jgi:peptidyl-prolyl cis-trans isomerase SurA
MDQHAAHSFPTASAAFLAAWALAMTGASGPLAAQKQPPRQAAAQPASPKAEREAQPGKSEQAIVVLVNDEPVTGYEIEQRSRFMALNANIGERVNENFKRMVQAESTNKQLRAILDQVIRSNPGKSREQIGAIFEERKKQFALSLQKHAIESARAGLVPRFRKEAKEELIEERLKLQEAKRLGIEITDAEVSSIMKGIVDRNKMTEAQFTQHLKGEGVDVSTMRERFRAQIAWREVVRRRFSAQVSITQRDVERMITASASEAGPERTRSSCRCKGSRWRCPAGPTRA